jgi:ParB family chromosome partitioning protein
MQTADQSGKGPVRKLGRGLTALLGAPVQVQAQPPGRQQGAGAIPAPTPSASNPTTQSEVARIPQEAPREAPTAVSEGRMLRELPVEQIVPNRRQPRTDFSEAALQSLAASIQKSGLMQPIMVRPTASGFELVAGERRWRAAKLIGLATIPAIVRDIDDQSAAELALIENVQREDLNPMERAIALQRLAEDFGLTHQAIADRVGLDRATISNLLRLAELDSATADLVRTGRLTQGHAKALLGITDPRSRSQFAASAMKEDWSVRELERRIQQRLRGGETLPAAAGGQPGAKEVSARTAHVADLERQLAEYLGTRVRIQLGRKKGSGRLSLDFYNLDQFDGLMQRIGFDSRGGGSISKK